MSRSLNLQNRGISGKDFKANIAFSRVILFEYYSELKEAIRTNIKKNYFFYLTNCQWQCIIKIGYLKC